jgi:competence protein ComEA
MGKWIWKPVLFTRKERLGIYALLILLICIQVLIWRRSEQIESIPVRVEELNVSTDTAYTKTDRSYKKSNELTSFNKRRDIRKVRFNPNEANDEVWLGWGLRPGTVKTIRRYLEKGGRFRAATDLFRIWGLDSLTALAMQDYVDIPSEQVNQASFNKRIIEKKPLVMVDLNASDSAAWESLPGVGPVLASRIVRYRKRLGGFISVDQLREVYGVSDTLMAMLEKHLLHGEQVQKRDWMLATEEELRSHPYIGYKMARLIVRYREQHPDVTQWEIWKRLPGVTDSVIQRWKMYFRL